MRRLLLLAAALAGAGCPGRDRCEPGWKPVLSGGRLDRPLLSIWGRADDDVLIVGGGAAATTEPPGLFLHWDGSGWEKFEAGFGQTYWWVWGPEGGGDVWLVGDHGTAMLWNGRTLTQVPTGTTATLFGVWGSAADDVWLVGGDPGGSGTTKDLVFHWDGKTLTRDDPPARGAAFFKVWGAGKDDVWVVGEGGTIWHRTPAGWTDFDPGTRDSLTTVHGCGPDEVYAVGGQAVYRWQGQSWSKVDAARPSSAAAGVHCGRDQVLVVGNGGLKLRFEKAAGRWIDESLSAPFDGDLHGAWISPSGQLWAAGGNYNAPGSSPRFGVIGFFGCPVPE